MILFSSRARALSEMGLALYALSTDPWSVEPQSNDEAVAYQLIRQVMLYGKHDDWDALQKWLKTSAEGRGSFI